LADTRTSQSAQVAPKIPAGDELAQAWEAYASGDAAGALSRLAALPDVRRAQVEVAYLAGLASARAGNPSIARQAFQAVLSGVESLSDPTRRVMLRRLARGHLNRLDHGTWDLEPETWERA
jgi:hypothetical protein